MAKETAWKERMKMQQCVMGWDLVVSTQYTKWKPSKGLSAVRHRIHV